MKIPSGLFDNMTKLENASVCFKSCTNVTSVPSDLFDNCLNLKNVRECFCGGGYNGDNSYSTKMKIKTSLPALWTRNNITSFSAYAHGCTSALNYN